MLGRLRAGLALSLAGLLAVGAFAQGSNAFTPSAPAIKPSGTPTATSSASPTASLARYSPPDSIAQNFADSACKITLDPGAERVRIGECKVLVVGDSIGMNLAAGLSTQLSRSKQIDLVVHTKSSTGLTKPDYYNWPAALKDDLDEYKPHLTIIMLGANDWQGMSTGGRSYSSGSAGWNENYRARIDKMTAMTVKSGSYLMWVGLPIMGLTHYGQGMHSLNDLFAERVQQQPGAVFVSTWDFFADSNGTFMLYGKVNGHRTKLRGSDRIHFSSIGQQVLGTYVLDQLREQFHVKLYSHGANVLTK